MTDLRTAAQQALEALHNIEWHGSAGAWMLDDCKVENAIHALRAALAEPVQEPDPGEYHGWVLREVLFEKGEPVGHREPVQEPVAWRTFDGEGGYDYRTYEDNEDYAAEWAKRNPRHVGWVEPLYIAPPQRPAEPVQEPVAWRYKKEGGGWFVSDNEPQYVEQWNDIQEIQPLFTAPPQRKP